MMVQRCMMLVCGWSLAHGVVSAPWTVSATANPWDFGVYVLKLINEAGRCLLWHREHELFGDRR
jgi:hypothetical protein